MDGGWQKLIKEGVISKYMGKKAAGSGLTVGHLQQVYATNGAKGVKAVLSETIDGETRVTKHVAIIDNINQYLSNIQKEQAFTSDMECVKDTLHKRQSKKHHADGGWRKLMKEGVVSKYMGGKAAGSGLGVEHLQQVYAKSGAEGVKAVLSETIDGETRVTTHVAIIDNINKYLSAIQNEM